MTFMHTYRVWGYRRSTPNTFSYMSAITSDLAVLERYVASAKSVSDVVGVVQYTSLDGAQPQAQEFLL